MDPVKNTVTLEELIGLIEKKYRVEVKGLNFAEGSQLYNDFVLNIESKKAEKAKLLAKSLKQIIEEEGIEGKFIDFTLVMGVKEEIIKHAPTLRVTIE